jgi:hypothetical protein
MGHQKEAFAVAPRPCWRCEWQISGSEFDEFDELDEHNSGFDRSPLSADGRPEYEESSTVG